MASLGSHWSLLRRFQVLVLLAISSVLLRLIFWPLPRPLFCGIGSPCTTGRPPKPNHYWTSLHRSAGLLARAAEHELPAAVGYSRSRKDCDLRGLLALLNTLGHALRSVTGSPQAYAAFLDALVPWLLGEPEVALAEPVEAETSADQQQAPPGLRCGDQQFSSAFSGGVREAPRFLVDFVAFGYDVDLLEVRLAEGRGQVDLFVISESNATQSGMPKALLFNELRRTPRFARYLGNVMHVVRPSDALDQRELARMAFEAQHSGSWEMEASLRKYHVNRLAAALARHPEVHKDLLAAIAQPDDVIAVQSDADELINAETLKHLRWCEVRSPLRWPIYVPAISMKKNLLWLQTTQDLARLHFGPLSTPELSGYLWRPGPYIWPLRDMLEARDNRRYDRMHSRGYFWSDPHLGLGGAIHLSSLADPVNYWYKRAGVIEASYTQASFDEAFLAAAGNGSLRAEDVARVSIRPWCHRTNPAAFAGGLSAEAQALVRRSTPAALRRSAARFCFASPPTDGPLAVAARAEWVELCKLPASAEKDR